MIRIGDVLLTEDVRRINLALFRDSGQAYLRSGAFGVEERRAIEQRIRNISGRRIRRILEAVPPFADSDIRPAWSHFMAVSAGTHPWPDANHRTALLAFDLAIVQASAQRIGLPVSRVAELVLASKAMRDGARRRRPGRARYYTIEELGDPDHPYRRLFAGFESDLIIKHA